MNKQLLVTAITERKVVVLRYNGFTRTVEPHCVGDSASGNLLLRCWQTGGGSASNEPFGWKLLDVSEIHSASVTEASFSSARPGYKRGDTAIRRIYAQL